MGDAPRPRPSASDGQARIHCKNYRSPVSHVLSVNAYFVFKISKQYYIGLSHDGTISIEQ